MFELLISRNEQVRNTSRLRWLPGLAVVVVLPLASCAKVEVSASKKKEPVTIEKIAGTDRSRLTLDARAAERIGLQTATVTMVPGAEGEAERMTVPYGAVLYDAKGTTFVYTNPAPLVYVREAIVVDVINGDTAVLNAGPSPNTSVVIIGGAELVGIEFGVGK